MTDGPSSDERDLWLDTLAITKACHHYDRPSVEVILAATDARELAVAVAMFAAMFIDAEGYDVDAKIEQLRRDTLAEWGQT